MGGDANFGSSTAFGSLLQKTWNGVIAPFFQFWLTNCGLWIPLALALVGLVGWRIWKARWRWGDRPSADVAFVLPAVAIFAIGYFFKTAPWEWDNLKLMVWGYFLILPFLWATSSGAGRFGRAARITLFGSDLSLCSPAWLPGTRALDSSACETRLCWRNQRRCRWNPFATDLQLSVMLQGAKLQDTGSSLDARI